jgi:hypothetical protein
LQQFKKIKGKNSPAFLGSFCSFKKLAFFTVCISKDSYQNFRQKKDCGVSVGQGHWATPF